MCVRLLAMNNVEFKEDQNNYIATLKVPSTQVQSYLSKQNDENKVEKKAPHVRKGSHLEKQTVERQSLR